MLIESQLGQVVGRLADVVLSRRHGATVASLARGSSKPPSPDQINVRETFGFWADYWHQNYMPNLRTWWNDAAMLRNRTYHRGTRSRSTGYGIFMAITPVIDYWAVLDNDWPYAPRVGSLPGCSILSSSQAVVQANGTLEISLTATCFDPPVSTGVGERYLVYAEGPFAFTVNFHRNYWEKWDSFDIETDGSTSCQGSFGDPGRFNVAGNEAVFLKFVRVTKDCRIARPIFHRILTAPST